MIFLKIAVDVGYSQVKAIGSNGKRILFPSVKAPYTSSALNEVFKLNPEYKVSHRTNIKKEDVLIGKAAQQSMFAISTLSREKPSEMHDLFILAAAYLCNAEGDTELVVGLPLDFYRAQRAELKARLESLNAFVQINDLPEKHINITNVSVFPQGAGVLLANGLDLAKDGKIALIDIGYYTTDYLLFDIINGSPMPIIEHCGSLGLGVHLIDKAVKKIYKDKTGALPPHFVLSDIIERKPIYFEGKKIELWGDIFITNKAIAEQISQAVLSAWGESTDKINQTVLAGGGSLLLQKYFNFPNIAVPNNPVLANAEGFLMMG